MSEPCRHHAVQATGPLCSSGCAGGCFRNNWTVLLGQSSIRPLTILMCSVIIWMFVFAISMGGFRFLQFEVKLPLGGDIVGILFDLLFLALGVFLIFSSGLILYGSLFTSPETAFLLSKPVTADRSSLTSTRGRWRSAAGRSCCWGRRC